MFHYGIIPSPLGTLILTGDDTGQHTQDLTGLYLPAHRHYTHLQQGGLQQGIRADERFADARTQLTEYFAGTRTTFTLPLVPQGTTFQQKVWRLLQGIPFGTAACYQDLAIGLHKPTAARAVGGAVGANPLSILIPCHRIIGKGGTLTGYAGGLKAKSWLLHHEGIRTAKDA